MTDLENQVFEHMQTGVGAVLRGRVESFKTTFMSPSAVIEHIESLGGLRDTPFETNGWQWDYWIRVEHGDHEYTVSGSGFYGGVTLTRGWSEE